MPKRKQREFDIEKLKIKRTARKSFSIPKELKMGERFTMKPMILHLNSPEKIPDENVCPSTSADRESWTDDNALETEISVEHIRSSELMSVFEFVLPDSASFNDCIDSANRNGDPLASTPLSPSDRKYFNFPETIESIKRVVPKGSSTLISNKPAQQEETLVIPDVSYIKGSGKENDSLINTITYSEVPSSDGFEVSDDQTFDNEDDEFGENNYFKEAGFRGSINSIPQRRKHKDEVGNRFEDKDNYNRGDSFGEARNIPIHSPKKKGKSGKGLRKKHTNEGENSFEDVNRGYTEDRFENVQNIQNEDLQENELKKTPTETSTSQRKTNKQVGHDIIHSRLTNSNHQIKKHGDEGGKSSEHIDGDNGRVGFQEAQNIQTDIPKRKRGPYKGVLLKTKRRSKTSKKAANSLSRLKNSSDLDFVEDVKINPKEEEKRDWPLCCLTTLKKKECHILQPVIRYDLPIDDLALMSLEKNSKKKCKH